MPTSTCGSIRVLLGILAVLFASPAAASVSLPVQLTTDAGQDINPTWGPSGTIIFQRSTAASGLGVPYDLYAVPVGAPGTASLFAENTTSPPNRPFGFGFLVPDWNHATNELLTSEAMGSHEYLAIDAAQSPVARNDFSSGDSAPINSLLTAPPGGGIGMIDVSRDGSTAVFRYNTRNGGEVGIRTSTYAALVENLMNPRFPTVTLTIVADQPGATCDAGNPGTQGAPCGADSDCGAGGTCLGTCIAHFSKVGQACADHRACDQIPNVTLDGICIKKPFVDHVVLNSSSLTGTELSQGVAMTPDGSQFILVELATSSPAGATNLVVRTTDSPGVTRRLTSNVATGARDTFPDIAPDGVRVVFSRVALGAAEADLWTINLDGTGLTQLTNTPGVSEGRPSWSPDGQSVAYHAIPVAVPVTADPNDPPPNHDIFAVEVPLDCETSPELPACSEPSPTSTPEPSATPTTSATQIVLATPTVTATSTPTPTGTSTPTSTGTATPTPTFTATATPRPSATSTQTATPTPTDTPGATPTATATGTVVPSASPSPTATPDDALCGAAPRAGCRGTLKGHRNLLVLKERTPDARDQLLWRFAKGAHTTVGDFGDPLTATDYAFCLFDGSGARVFRATVPANGLCPGGRSGRPCWAIGRAGDRHYRYKDDARTPDGIDRVVLQPGRDGRTRITLRGRGENLLLPALPLALPVRAQLHADSGMCWDATFGEARVRKNDNRQFQGRAD